MDQNQVISIRRACGGDLPSILQIEKSSFAGDAWNREQFLDYLASSGNSLFLVAVIDEVVIGYALAFYTGVRAEVDSIAVIHSRRGQGAGVALLRRLIGCSGVVDSGLST